MIRLITITLTQSILLCAAQVLLKHALLIMGHVTASWTFVRSLLTNWWLLASGITFTLASLLWMYLLKNYPFSIAYPLSSLTYVFGMLCATVIFHENVRVAQWIGVLLIISGCALIAK
ncbi:MAG TPA: hypothetical protein DEO38_05005 [Bacteroidales bacterium]|jgi:undecaprenyl phosphate-alpha-L-ara4N flippase subunit ArnE|nr:hypothetical protein [Bacteroidales bacterium]